ncbi:MAG TPA: DUF222 domain-containing protein [Candidatus Dormibacteraeota bacterium]|nr:DUF222 domain-containing protein [Candidatus Dormibacteraeota bacterium]
MLQQVYSPAEKADILRYLRLSIDRLELQFSELAADFAQSDQYDEDGFNTPLDWLRINCHLTAKQAGDRIAVGLADVGRSKAALEDGDIGFAHLVVIARTANAVGKHVDEESLVELATELSPGKLFYRCEQYRHSVDAKGYGQQQGNAVENRYLHLNTCEDGCLMFSGMLDPMGGAALRTALEPLSKPTGADDHRSLPQRNADGLVEMACGGKPANLQITASVETVKALAGSTGGENEFTLPIAANAVQRLACDCSVMRVLLDQESVIVDIGRSKRIVSGPARRALKARDGHCQWPGCERPASRCEGHHIVHWVNGGSSNLSNLVLLCHRHHWMVHEGGWQLIKTEDGRLTTVAPMVRFGRGPD